MKTFAVIGLGRFGTEAATRLYEYGMDVIAIDTEEDSITPIVNKVTRGVVADATDKEVLKSLGINRCDCAIVATGSNFASSVLVTMHLKSFGVPYIICKAHDDTHKEILEKLGANEVIIPERVVANKVAMSLVSPNLMDFMELSSDFGMIERVVPQTWIGKSIRELNIRADYNVNIVAIKENGNMNVSFAPDFVLNQKQTLICLGSYKDLEKIKRKR